jgi:hypothetical protein
LGNKREEEQRRRTSNLPKFGSRGFPDNEWVLIGRILDLDIPLSLSPSLSPSLSLSLSLPPSLKWEKESWRGHRDIKLKKVNNVGK